MCVTIDKRWKFHMRATLVLLFLMQMVILLSAAPKTAVVITYGVFYICIVCVLGLYKWYIFTRKELMIKHMAFSASVPPTMMLAGAGIVNTLAVYLLTNIAFLLWTYISEYWLKRQIESLWTLVVGDSAKTINWIDSHRDMYNKVAVVGFDEYEEIREKIRMYRIPVILTDVMPSKQLIEIARQEKVMIHYLSDTGEDLSEIFTKIKKLEGLYVAGPFAG